MALVLGEVMAVSALALLAFILTLWLVSLRLRDASIVDPAWPVGFVIVAWIALAKPRAHARAAVDAGVPLALA
jgi:steroid 5-alpha reductase family enzyme